MSYRLEITDNTLKSIEKLKKSGNKPVLKKLAILLNELIENPKKGTGQPEQLKHELSGYLSRRINKEHRIVYKIDDASKIVTVVSAKGHYSG